MLFSIRFKPLVLRLFLMLSGFAQSAHGQGAGLYDDQHGIVTKLSEETTTPFRFVGRTLEGQGTERKFTVEQFRGSVARFPAVQSCLTDEQASATEPDLSSFDWTKMRGAEDATVCLFRVASSYQNIDAFESWIAQFGFHHASRSEYRPTRQIGPSIKLCASRGRSDPNDRLIPSGIFGNFLRFDHSSSIRARFELDGTVASMQFSYNTK
jgi:hypothetical protein